jgi:hypothetical protein
LAEYFNERPPVNLRVDAASDLSFSRRVKGIRKNIQCGLSFKTSRAVQFA